MTVQQPGKVGHILADLAAGFGLLTRLPVGWLGPRHAPHAPGRAVWSYPLAGGLLGGIAAGCLIGLHMLGLSTLLSAAWTLAVSVWLSGGLHEDGIADLADGCGGGRTPERRLEIMRDSRIGAFGAMALILSLGVRLAAMEWLAVAPPLQLFEWFVATGALSRVGMLPVLLLRNARPDGLAEALGAISRPVLLLSLAIGAALAFGLIAWPWAPAMIAAALAVGAAVAVYARMRLGGRTGDVLGAAAISAECVLLTLATLALSGG